MSRTRVALYEFVPYGAPELLEVQRSYLTRAVSTASTGVVLLFLLAFAVTAWFAGHPIETPMGHDRVWVLEPPPLIPPPPSIAPPVSAPAVTPPSGGRAVPTPDETADPSRTLPSQAELVPPGPGDTHSGESGITPVAPPPTLPSPDEWVFHDVEPQPAVAPTPAYPDIAREAQVEGTVMLRLLVDVDGHVKDVRLLKSVPLLDEAAISAAWKWVFTPALANGHPVAVWVAVPFRFTLH